MYEGFLCVHLHMCVCVCVCVCVRDIEKETEISTYKAIRSKIVLGAMF